MDINQKRRRWKMSGMSDAEIEQMTDDSMSLGGSSDEGGDLSSGAQDVAPKSDNRAQKLALEKSTENAGGTADTAGNLAMSSGNPYGIAAGVGLKTVGMIQNKKAQKREMEAKLKLDRIEKQQNAIQSLMGISQNMGLA